MTPQAHRAVPCRCQACARERMTLRELILSVAFMAELIIALVAVLLAGSSPAPVQ